MEYQKVMVVICDDDRNIQNLLYNCLEEYQKGKLFEFQIKTFSSGEELLNYESIEQCDLLFLDIEMKDVNGIQVSHILRELRKLDNLQIIFVSAFDRYMKEMFDVRPFQYLSKPILKEKLFSTLDSFCRLYTKNTTVFSFKIGRIAYRVPYGEIIYFESCRRKIIIHTITDTYEFYEKMDVLEEILKRGSFYRIHQSYLVNPIFIKHYSSQYIILENGLKIAISAKYKKEFLEMQLSE